MAMSRRLSERSIDHVLLERGQVANSWRTERWDSLRLLTPNWQSRLPGRAYEGEDPDGFMTMPEIIRFIEEYANKVSVPVHTNTPVTSVERTDGGYVVRTPEGEWHCLVVVLATGAFNKPHIPELAEEFPPGITTLTPIQYRNPGQLEEGEVLIVGASATGTQIAEEVHRSGRPVTLAVGEHVRAPRVYRGMDIQWWMDAVGVLDERYDEVDDIVRARKVPSPQLAGSPDRTTLDLNTLTNMGVKLTGRLVGLSRGKGQFSGSLRNMCSLADLKMARLLGRIDEWATDNGLDGEVAAPHRFPPTEVETSPPLGLDLTTGRFQTVVWATGFRPDYSWLRVPVLDRKGYVRHDGGVVDSPGMYLLGMPFLRRRKSSFIHGTDDDTSDLSADLASYLDSTVTTP